jgi:hypothetical protein
MVLGEIGNGANATLEITPGTYLVNVSYIEIKQVEFGRPSGTLSASFTVLPGKAAILCLQGGRSSPESLMFFPPGLALK